MSFCTIVIFGYLLGGRTLCEVPLTEVAALPDVKFVSADEVPEETKEKAISFCPIGSPNGLNVI